MDRDKLKTEIQEIKDKRIKLYNELESARDYKEVMNIRNNLDELYKEQQSKTLELKDMENRKENQTTEDQQERTIENQFDPISTYGENTSKNGLRSIGTFKSGKPVEPTKTDSIELRSGEKFSDRIEKKEKLDLGKYIRGLVTGNWEGAEAEKRAVTTSSIGTIIPTVLSSQVLDYALNTSIFLKSEVPTVPMDSNNLTYAKVKRIGSPEFIKTQETSGTPSFMEKDYFKNELSEGKQIDLDLEEVTLKAKTCYAYSYVSLESIKSAKNLNQILIKAFGDVVSNAIDYAFLYGQYNSAESKFEEFAPEGILNDTNILNLTTKATSWDDYIKAVGKIKGYNGLPSHYAINSITEENLNLLKTQDGQYLNKPQCLEFLSPVVSNQLEEETSLVFDKNALVIGIQNNLVIRMITDSDYCIKNGAIGFQIYTMLDCKTLYPESICKISLEQTS